jgi:N-acetylmuramoyl-L-alanine amidase/type II secretory pathway predicted ATPase ExeA
MFLDFFQLREDPFGVTPDPAYLYPSRTHCEALDSLAEGILDGRGFLALIAEPGMGKTTLLNQVLEGLRDKARAAFLFQTQCNSREFFQYLLSELGVDSTGMGLVAMHNKLNEMLFNEMLAGRRFVLIVDEAQNLNDSVLETIRLLSNFETSNTKLLQIVLAGQPQLGEKLQQKQLAQLLQRITVVKHLEALLPEETAGYICHRLKVAGYSGETLFEPGASALVAEYSQGVPRVINKICYGALSEAYVEGRLAVSRDHVAKANRNLGLAVPLRPMPMAVPSPEPVEALPEYAFAEPSPEDEFAEPLPDFAELLPEQAEALPEPVEPLPAAVEASTAPVEPWPSRIAAVPARVSVAPAPAALKLTYKAPRERGSRRWPLGAIALLAILLAAGLVVPRSIPREILQSVRDYVTATKDPEKQRTEADGGSRTPMYSESLRNGAAVDATLIDQAMQQAMPMITTTPASPKAFPISSEGGAGRASQPSLTRELGLKINRIAIDPGHGGYDTGTVGPHGLLEKDLCLDVALRLGELIQQNIPGAEVVYTRDDDRYVSLEDRTAIANTANADVFISIHANSSDIQEVHGAETYYLSLTASQRSKELATRENMLAKSSLHDLQELIREITRNDKIAESKLLAVDIQGALSQHLQLANQTERNRGVKQAPFIVLTGAHMPAALSEISFVSNTRDESLLLGSDQRQRVAEGLYRGIAAYLSSLNHAPRNEQKLVTENRPGGSSSLASSTAGNGRNSR